MTHSFLTYDVVYQSMVFLDRNEDLAALEERWRSGQAQFFILWGRRRVGKTELIARFIQDKRSILYEATEGSAGDQLGDFSQVLAGESGGEFLSLNPAKSWEAALAAVAQFVGNQPTVIALDEFQYLSRRTPELGSLLNRWWRQTGRNLPIFIILSGSEVSFFDRHVLTGTTYGRRTGQLQLRPLGYNTAGEFFPDYSPAEKIRAFAVCGGMPYYLEQFNPKVSVKQNILRVILRRDGVLHEEARLLLREELSDPHLYFSILRAIAAGKTKFGEISQAAGVDRNRLAQMLTVLGELYLVERMVPVTVTDPNRSRHTRYQIRDAYLRFWFRFVLPHQSELQTRGGAELILKQVVEPQLDQFVSMPAFEEVAQAYLQAVEQAGRVGRWWGQVPTGTGRQTERREIDAVAVDSRGVVTALGACKWTNQLVSLSEHRLLSHLREFVPGAASARLYLFSREGFDAALYDLSGRNSDRIRLVTPKDLFTMESG